MEGYKGPDFAFKFILFDTAPHQDVRALLRACNSYFIEGISLIVFVLRRDRIASEVNFLAAVIRNLSESSGSRRSALVVNYKDYELLSATEESVTMDLTPRYPNLGKLANFAARGTFQLQLHESDEQATLRLQQLVKESIEMEFCRTIFQEDSVLRSLTEMLVFIVSGSWRLLRWCCTGIYECARRLCTSDNHEY